MTIALIYGVGHLQSGSGPITVLCLKGFQDCLNRALVETPVNGWQVRCQGELTLGMLTRTLEPMLKPWLLTEQSL